MSVALDLATFPLQFVSSPLWLDWYWNWKWLVM